MVVFDEFGPEKILEVYNPKIGMRGFVVIDNTALGPAKGGIRMTPTVTVEEVARLARAMTWKCALAELPFGGGKSGIIADDRIISKEKKKEIVQAFAEALKVVSPKMYVAAPDMNTAEEEMKWYADANGSLKSCTGKPENVCYKPGERCGIPHEYGSTGFGVYHSTVVAAEQIGLNLKKATVAIEGFGNVGQFAAKYLSENGVKIVAVSDSRGVIYNKKGFDFKKLLKIKKEKRTVTEYGEGKVSPSRDILRVNADILITAAVPDLIRAGNVDDIKAKLIVEGSNIPATAEVEELLHRKKILVVPDFVANAGGVISSYAEYMGKHPDKMFKLVENKIKKNAKLVLETAKKQGVKPRDAAMEIAVSRVRKVCKTCRI